MDLQRGICSLCSKSGKVLTSSNAEDFLSCLPRILYENFLTESMLEKIKNYIKICSLCCYKLELANETKKMMNMIDDNLSKAIAKECHFCKSDKCVIKVKDDWKDIVQRTEGLLKPADFPVNICYRCMFYFDTIYTFKVKLSYKFPHLLLSKKSSKLSQIQNDTPKRKSLSLSPQNSKKRRIFTDCFAYLQPLCNNNYYVDDMLKADAKMYKKVAYVDLKDMKNIKGTPKVRPVIKIKLKTRKKQEKEKQLKSLSRTLQENNIISQPYVKLCKSEEIPRKLQKKKQKRLSLSMGQIQETSEKNLDETPKAADAINLAPKRRVSLYAEPTNDDNTDIEVEAETDVDGNLEVNAEMEPEIKDKIDVGPNAETETEIETTTETECEGEGEPEHEPGREPEREPDCEGEREPEREHDCEHEPELEFDLELEHEPEPEPEPEYVVEHDHEPDPDPDPDPSTETENTDTENQINSEEINNIVEKYIKVSAFSDSAKLELLQEIEENKVERNDNKVTSKENKNINSEKHEQSGTNREINSAVLESAKEEDEHESPHSSPASQETLRNTATKSDSGSEESDLDVSDKNRNNTISEKDPLNGSERKKKRVTFSDEIK